MSGPVCAGLSAPLVWCVRASPSGYVKRMPTYPLSHPWMIRSLMTCWNWMNSGPLSGQKNKGWVWIALCRRTRQIVSYFIGGRSEEDCWRLWSWFPPDHRHCATFSDFWETYDAVFGHLGMVHQSVGKETGQTAHVVHEVGVSPTLEQHPAPTARTFCPQDTFLFQDPPVS